MKRWIVGLATVVVLVLSWGPVEARADSLDDFNDGNADGWTFLEFDPRGTGEWSVENQTLVNYASTDWHIGLVDDLFVSWVHHAYEGDTRFPEFLDRFPSFEVVERHDDFEVRHYRPAPPPAT